MSSASMNIIIKQNRSLLTSKKESFKGNNREGIYTDKNKIKNLISFKKTSEKELNQIKKNIRIHAKKAQKKELIYYGALFGIATVLIILFLINP